VLSHLRIFIVSAVAAMLVCSPIQGAAPSSEKWEKEVAAFEAQDRTNPPPMHAILFVGSSSIRMWTNLHEMMPGKTIVRRGFGGSHLYDVNAYFDRLVLRYHPSKIVLYAGENDIASGRSPAEAFADFKEFASKVAEHLPRTRIYYLSAKHSPSRWHYSPQIGELNDKIRKYARRRVNIDFVDVAELLLDAHGRPNPAFFIKDQLHVNELGYQRWARRIYQAIQDR
jgi:lysophospholipase L1-like esterase